MLPMGWPPPPPPPPPRGGKPPWLDAEDAWKLLRCLDQDAVLLAGAVDADTGFASTDKLRVHDGVATELARSRVRCSCAGFVRLRACSLRVM